jgi:hypothetical protein
MQLQQLLSSQVPQSGGQRCNVKRVHRVPPEVKWYVVTVTRLLSYRPASIEPPPWKLSIQEVLPEKKRENAKTRHLLGLACLFKVCFSTTLSIAKLHSVADKWVNESGTMRE